MKIKLLLISLIFCFTASVSFAQFDKLVFQLGVGIVNPDKQLRGNNYIQYQNSYPYFNYNTMKWDTVYSPNGWAFVDSSLISKNLQAQTGFYINGTAKINIDKYETVRLIGSLSFSAFNAFQSAKSGFVPLLTYNGAYSQPLSYDYNASNFGIGLGIEIAPLSFTKLISPFINGTFNFNFLNSKLSRTTGPNDSTSINFTGFRLGLNIGAGIEFKVSPQFGIALGMKYDFGNLLLKNTDQAGLVEWGRTNASLNDDEGYYISNLYGALGDRYRGNIKSDSKQLNWSTFYVAVNFYPNIGKTTTTKK
jgi:hypothetical protein